jgi:hypothetical protein
VETEFVRKRLETLGVSVEPPARRAFGYYAQHLPAEVAKAAATVKAGGLVTE